jgi:hypothetical protein
MTTPNSAGGFHSTQDADSEGEEGKFFVWTPDEIREVLGDGANPFMAVYGVTPSGNASTSSAHGFEGENILEFVANLEQRPALAEARCKLFEAREQRVHPGRDDVADQEIWHDPDHPSAIVAVTGRRAPPQASPEPASDSRLGAEILRGAQYREQTEGKGPIRSVGAREKRSQAAGQAWHLLWTFLLAVGA